MNIESKVRRLALEHNLVSSFTSFLAVDSSQRTEGNVGVTVPIAVPVPDGMRYTTNISDR